MRRRGSTRRRSPALRETIETMRRSDDDFATRDAADREFHALIAGASGNGALPAAGRERSGTSAAAASGRCSKATSTPPRCARARSTTTPRSSPRSSAATRPPRAARWIDHLQHVVGEFQRRWDELDDGIAPAVANARRPGGEEAQTVEVEVPIRAAFRRRPFPRRRFAIMTQMLPRLTRIAAALAMVAVALPVAAKEFRNSDVHPADYPTVMAVNYMSDIISKKTNGKHSIKTYFGGTLGSEKDTIEQTKLGGARPRAHQRRADEQHRARDDGADDAVPVPVEGAHAQGARRPDRRRDPEGLPRRRASSASRSTTRAPARSTRSRSRSSRWPTPRA